MLLSTSIIIVLAVWLAAYLLTFAGRNRSMHLTGLGLLAYALALSARLLADLAATPTSIGFLRAALAIGIFAPALWMGATAQLIPPASRWHRPMIGMWRYLILPLAAFDAGLAIGTPWLIDPTDGTPGPAFWLHVAVVAIMAADALIALYLARRDLDGPFRWLLIAVGILFALSITAAALPHALTGSLLWSTAVGIDLLLLGLAIAAHDAFETGERWGPHLLRSAVAALIPAAFVGLQLAILAEVSGLSTTSIAVSLAILSTLVVLQTSGRALGRWFGRLLPGDVTLRTEREQLDATAERLDRRAMPSTSRRPGAASLDRKAFDRAVRRALSDLRDLPRLATSPLLQTALIPEDDPVASLDRARALHDLLVEAIEQLRPSGDEGFSTQPARRHFNALHYPYVVGLRPYARQAIAGSVDASELDPDVAKALTWLRNEVPERTLYNWQSAGAKLIASALWERIGSELDHGHRPGGGTA